MSILSRHARKPRLSPSQKAATPGKSAQRDAMRGHMPARHTPPAPESVNVQPAFDPAVHRFLAESGYLDATGFDASTPLYECGTCGVKDPGVGPNLQCEACGAYTLRALPEPLLSPGVLDTLEGADFPPLDNFDTFADDAADLADEFRRESAELMARHRAEHKALMARFGAKYAALDRRLADLV